MQLYQRRQQYCHNWFQLAQLYLATCIQSVSQSDSTQQLQPALGRLKFLLVISLVGYWIGLRDHFLSLSLRVAGIVVQLARLSRYSSFVGFVQCVTGRAIASMNAVFELTCNKTVKVPQKTDRKIHFFLNKESRNKQLLGFPNSQLN